MPDREPAAAPRILVVDDDSEIRDLISHSLRRHGYEAAPAASVAQADDLRRRGHFDLIILDVMMPGEDGLSFCRRISLDSDIPIIILSALDSSSDKIVGLEFGADNYIAKPCEPRELVAHIRAVLRRARPPAGEAPGLARTVAFEGWQLDLIARYLRDPRGVVVDLASNEFLLMHAFIEAPRRSLSRDALSDILHGAAPGGAIDRSIDVQVSRLRRKLGGDGARLIRTVRHEGYMFTGTVQAR